MIRNICLCSRNGQRANKITQNLSESYSICFLSDCVMNVPSGVVLINKFGLKKLGKSLRSLANKKESKFLNQHLEPV